MMTITATRGYMTICMKNKLNIRNAAAVLMLSCLFFLCNVNIMAETNGIYVSDSKLYVVIISDSTVILESPYWGGVQPIPNKVICKYRNLGCGFMQISSINDYYSEAVGGMQISKKDTLCVDGNVVKFEFPNYQDSPLVVELGYGNEKKQILCSEGIGMICLPFNISKFEFSIRPLIYNQYGYDYCYNGITEFRYNDCVYIDGSVVISLPGIEYGYFDQWRIIDDVIEIVDKDKIRWRNILLTRQNSMPNGNMNF